MNLYSADDELLGTWQGSGNQTTFAIPYDLADDTAYRVGVQVRDGVQLWSTEASSTFSVDYLPPPAPTVTVEWDTERGAGVLMIVNLAPAGGEPAAVSNNIYRDGLLIAEGYPLNTAFVDPLPNTSGSTYVVEAVSALPSSANSEPATLPFNLDVYRRFWLNAGPGWAVVASFYGNVNRSRETGVTREVEQYSGRAYGVETIGEGATDEFSFSCTVVQAEDSPAGFHAVAAARTTVCFREPSGRYFVSLPRMAEATEQDITASMSFKATRVDYTEGV